MGKTVGISEYWDTRLKRWVETGVRKSKSECVEDGLKCIERKLETEVDQWLEFRESKQNGEGNRTED